jgi:predicted metal-dependent hydrolase
VIPTLPLALRDRLAGTILRALRDGQARGELARLDGEPAARAWLGGEQACWAEALARRAQAARGALKSCPLSPAGDDLGQALDDAAALFDAGLGFEVHELLEPHWLAAAGGAREALQGLIQVAVGWQHRANGNLAGARSLLRDGGERLHRGRLPGLDLQPFARAALAAAAALAAGADVSPARFPRALQPAASILDGRRSGPPPGGAPRGQS